MRLLKIGVQEDLVLRRVENECRTVLRTIGVPEEMIERPRNLHALIVLILPVSAGNLERSLRHIPAIYGNLQELSPLFCKIFRENSCRKRLSFFSDALVRVLWSHYISVELDYLVDYLTVLLNDSTR